MSNKSYGLLAILLISPIIFFKAIDSIPVEASVGYYGAILGGSLSGFITLLGVNRTIRHQKIEKYIETYPEKIKSLSRINGSIDRVLGDQEEEYDYDDVSVKALISMISQEAAIVSAKLYKDTVKTVSEIEVQVDEINFSTSNYYDPVTEEYMTENDESLQAYRDNIRDLLIDYKILLSKEERLLNELVENFQP